MKRVFSGIQPTGDIHLGNYIGAINNWVNLQQGNNCLFSIVDLHAITVFQNPNELKKNILSTISWLIACGIDVDKSVLFLQSRNVHHSELAWLLSCIARIGWLNRMTQFKEKSINTQANNSVGLYSYPILQAADILLYDTDIIPIGSDQIQHIELARDIAIKFNNDYKCDIFKIPNYIINDNLSRIMSLQDVTKKMSKSDNNLNSKILFSDNEDIIYKKILKARTDSLPPLSSYEEIETRLEVKNLLGIYSFLIQKDLRAVTESYLGKNFSVLKKDLAELLIKVIIPLQKKHDELSQDVPYMYSILEKGNNNAILLAQKKIKQVKEIIGFI